MADATPPNTDSSSPSAARGKSGKLKIIALLVVAMIGEAGVFIFMGAGSATPAAASAVDGAPKPEAAAIVKAPVETAKADGLAEIEVHNFTVTNNIAAADTIVHVAFKMYAIVPSDQKSAFEDAAMVKNKARVREAVEKIARSATLDDLNDPNLGTLKRLLKEEVNKVLKQSYIVEVVISDFRTMEQ